MAERGTRKGRGACLFGAVPACELAILRAVFHSKDLSLIGRCVGPSAPRTPIVKHGCASCCSTACANRSIMDRDTNSLSNRRHSCFDDGRQGSSDNHQDCRYSDDRHGQQRRRSSQSPIVFQLLRRCSSAPSHSMHRPPPPASHAHTLLLSGPLDYMPGRESFSLFAAQRFACHSLTIDHEGSIPTSVPNANGNRFQGLVLHDNGKERTPLYSLLSAFPTSTGSKERVCPPSPPGHPLSSSSLFSQATARSMTTRTRGNRPSPSPPPHEGGHRADDDDVDDDDPPPTP
jgi:hypothetical protein